MIEGKVSLVMAYRGATINYFYPDLLNFIHSCQMTTIFRSWSPSPPFRAELVGGLPFWPKLLGRQILAVHRGVDRKAWRRSILRTLKPLDS